MARVNITLVSRGDIIMTMMYGRYMLIRLRMSSDIGISTGTRGREMKDELLNEIHHPSEIKEKTWWW